MYHCGMRQVGERHVAYKVDLMVWSNRLDLLALSNFKGEVQIHRLHWQKVWSLPPPKENVTVQAMAWRPDGKIVPGPKEKCSVTVTADNTLSDRTGVLAVGYSSGLVYIVDIEDKEILNKYSFDQETSDVFENSKQFGVTCITWAIRADTLESSTEPNIYEDSSLFLQKLPVSGEYKNQGTDENTKDFKEIQVPTQLNMLVVGYGTGYIYMNIYGSYPYGTIHLAQVAKDDLGEYKVLDIHLSDDFSLMQVLYIDRLTNNLLVAVLNTSVLSAYAEEMFTVAKKHGEIVRLLSYLDQTMISITEAWEHILLEMDAKMADVASAVPEGGVSADLLELLMLGTPSVELEVHLLHKLTVNDLKKFGNSIELSYSTIQKLVLKQLNIVGQSLIYYLSEIRGLSRIPDRFKILGIEENTVSAGIRACCAFLNKCLELQQVIDTSMRNYKAFFRWLFVVIVRLLGEQTPSEIVKITQQELAHIAEFLYNFDNVQIENSDGSQDKTVKFNLERLGQYLEDQELTILPESEENSWHKFLKENACLLKDNDIFYSMAEFKRYSLVQQHNYLKKAFLQIFDVSKRDTGKYFSTLYNLKCCEDPSNKLMDNLRICQTYDASENRFMMAFMDSTNEREGLHFMAVNIRDKTCTVNAMKYCFSSSLIEERNQPHDNEYLAVLDLQFYSSEYLSVLTQHPNIVENSIFIQMPVKIALDNSNELNIKSKSYIFNEKLLKKNISPFIEQGIYKVLDKLDGFRIAVSGGRKVAVVLSRSHRKVRVFEMEVDGDDEEDETLDTTPQSLSTNDQDTPDKHNLTSTEDITF